VFHLLLVVIYMAFISLGLPDSILGAAWPSMYRGFGVSVSHAGIVSTIISLGTVISSLQSDRLTKKLGTGKVTTISVGMTAIALFGFSTCNNFLTLCIWAIPYGLGAGSVDASLNNYVALHYESRHMSWLHCMWGIGASLGPYIMGAALTGGHGWRAGYRYIFYIQIILTVILIFSIPIWEKNKKRSFAVENEGEIIARPLSLKDIVKMPKAKAIMVTFFCYCAIESTTGLWAGSYLVFYKGMSPEVVASLASLFFVGITVGRALSGFLTIKLNDRKMIRLGETIILVGVVMLLIPYGKMLSLVGFSLIGLGCAPIYPCIIHSTPEYFGAEKSQAMIGVQMASAYVGTCVMPPLFGIIADSISVVLLPVYISFILLIMMYMYEKVVHK